MSLSQRLRVVPVLAGGLITLAGCSGTPSVDSGNVEANVTGSVKVDGVPVKDAEIAFDPSNIQRPSGARTGPIKGGTYTVKTLTGRNTVKITGKFARSKPLLQTQTQSVDVKSGDNTFDLEFTGK